MAYDVYLDKVLLPVAPSKIKTMIKNNNRIIELINEGEVNVLKDAGLTELSFTVLLPNQKYPFAKYINGFKNAAYYLNVLQEYKKNKQPFQLIISRTLPNGNVLFYTSMKVSLEDYDIEESVADGFDTKVTINLTQYKAYGTKTVNVSAYIRPTQNRADGSGANTAGTSYTIKSGDTLWNIAKKKMGSGAKWTTLYNANKTVIENAAKSRGRASSNNGHWIYPNTVIIIPDGNFTANKTVGEYSGTGGSKNNPPFSILTSQFGAVKTGIKTWNEALGYYNARGGKGKGWKIVDSKRKVISL